MESYYCQECGNEVIEDKLKDHALQHLVNMTVIEDGDLFKMYERVKEL